MTVIQKRVVCTKFDIYVFINNNDRRPKPSNYAVRDTQHILDIHFKLFPFKGSKLYTQHML